jgi:hypothetical protein
MILLPSCDAVEAPFPLAFPKDMKIVRTPQISAAYQRATDTHSINIRDERPEIPPSVKMGSSIMPGQKTMRVDRSRESEAFA